MIGQVLHRWSCAQQTVAALLPPSLLIPAPALQSTSSFSSTATGTDPPPLPTPRIFGHELLQAFSFHLFAKRPIEPITSESALRREVMRRIALSALQIRFNVQQRQDPLFTFVDFNQARFAWKRF
jgi:hypothetical protein